MIRLKNVDTGVQIVVTDDKAARLLAGSSDALAGRFEAVPEDQQAHAETEYQEQLAAARDTKANTRRRQGATSIASALAEDSRPGRIRRIG
ncbi:hypothetical protein [Tsukamurella tyrosinosolvens]|uniref:hypothetical protein n=1 Tax=Tsukamurella tyrosinosolvens TaxID=57704 RepID=UPI003F49D08E